MEVADNVLWADQTYSPLYSTEGRQLISDHVIALDTDEYRKACNKLRAVTLISLVYAFEISAKLYQNTASTEIDNRVVAHPAITCIARPGKEHMGEDSPSH